MKQEIGGYLELEVFHGKEYYPDLVKVNLGRTALCWLLESRKIETRILRRLFLPTFPFIQENTSIWSIITGS